MVVVAAAAAAAAVVVVAVVGVYIHDLIIVESGEKK